MDTTSSYIYIGIYFVMLLMLMLMTACAQYPTRYYQNVRITDGPYRGELGRLIGDCSGIENYKVRLLNNHIVCVRVWDMEDNT